MFSKKLIIILAIVILVLLAFGVWLGTFVVQNTKSSDQTRPSEYSVVYLATGDIYYGKIDWFPWPRMRNVWVLQRPANPGGQFGIIKFTQAIWQPIDKVYLNPQQIVFWTRLRADSNLIDYFNNPDLMGAVPAPTSFQAPAAPPPPSSVPDISPATSTR